MPDMSDMSDMLDALEHGFSRQPGSCFARVSILTRRIAPSRTMGNDLAGWPSIELRCFAMLLWPGWSGFSPVD